jgi:hypothetical protein
MSSHLSKLIIEQNYISVMSHTGNLSLRPTQAGVTLCLTIIVSKVICRT